jgi:amino acid permease
VNNCPLESERKIMLFLVAALLLMGIMLGTAAHLPVPVTLVAAAVIAGWLLVFFLRERRHNDEVTSR